MFTHTIENVTGNASGGHAFEVGERLSEVSDADAATETGFDPGHLHVKVPFTFGIQVASMRDPEVVAHASFGFIRP